VKIAVEEKWARVAAAMEMEQREAREARDKMRRMGRRLAIGAAVVIFLAVISFLR
jgi:urease accessory protein UreF